MIERTITYSSSTAVVTWYYLSSVPEPSAAAPICRVALSLLFSAMYRLWATCEAGVLGSRVVVYGVTVGCCTGMAGGV